MRFARGDLVTVFDAEDRPDPNQLLKCARLFASAPAPVGCVQARLAVDHAEETFFTRQFAPEYATLFDILLPWMAGRELLLPLGGTSNHFRRRVLEDCGGWYPYNVTEDIDIGIHLMRDGWRIFTVESITWEEAPLTFFAWLNQRVRWHKGWLQTWLVHMRSPRQL
ncbi:glycosyltransferase family 2 protein [Breoghania sp.]|uniref:glycosyltransferase family 2 protein n=1 Tax=Breoghania sp. TaxID=2065378 RepID=UPI00260EE7F5|nr:glycosyltransferase family 2 protein [Breoghania sp.]MDJ0932916.1 glycosyltransferase family 2 protein [Breoghania sp.]